MVTMTGSPAAIAKLIHGAPVRQDGDVAKAKNDTADRKKMASSGAAMPDGSYPIANEADLGKAIHAVGRGGASHNAIRKHIISRAKSLGASSKIPDNWNADGSIKESSVAKTASDSVAKDMGDIGPDLDEGVDGLDPTVPLAAPDDMAPGDPTDPGSPAWESIDAATAQKWTSIAVRLKNALSVMSDRELLEAATADPDDEDNAWDLQDAMCAVDYVISTLAVFAAGEQAEADLCGEAMDAIGKAIGGFDTGPLDVIEGLVGVAKSGRVLSAANEAHLREAHARLNTVLSSLPQAPATDDGQPVAKSKEAAMTATTAAPRKVAKDAVPSAEEQAANTGPVSAGGTTGLGQPRVTGPDAALPDDGPQAALPGDPPGRTVIKGALRVAVYDGARRLAGLVDPAAIGQVAKASDDSDGGSAPALQAVFDENGDLIGVVDPSAIQPVAGAGGKAADDGADDAAAADDSDMTPAPPAETGTPADAVTPDSTVAKSSDTQLFRVLESTIAKAVAAALDGRTPAEDVAKQADVAGLLQEVETLKARLVTVEEHPAAPKVFTNGQVPPANQLRGQDQGAATQVDVAKARQRKAELAAADGPEQARIAKEMQAQAVDVLAAMHAGR
jgi:hypothetical protein